MNRGEGAMVSEACKESGATEATEHNVVCNGERVNAFPPRLGRQGHILFPLPFNIILEVLRVQQGKKKKEKSYSLERGNKAIPFVDFWN